MRGAQSKGLYQMTTVETVDKVTSALCEYRAASQRLEAGAS